MIRRTIAIVAAAVLLAVPAAAAEAAAPGWGALVEGGGLLAFAGAVYHLLHRHLGEIVTDRRAAAAQRKLDAAAYTVAVEKFSKVASNNGAMLAIVVDRLPRLNDGDDAIN